MDQSKCQLIQWFASRIIFNEAAFSLNQKGFYNPQSRSYWIFIGVTNSYSSLPQPTALDHSSDQPATILTEFCDCQFTKMQDSMIGNAKLNNLSFFSVTQASEVVVADSMEDSDL